MLSEHIVRKGLRTKIFGGKIYTFDAIDSTNNCAKAVAGCGAQEGTVVIAEQQTQGRGRHGKSWFSRPNENLTFSLVLRPKLSPHAINLLPLYIAVAVAQSIERTVGVKVECKWPNDLLINKKKVAGILIEGSIKQNTVEYVVIGIGVNVNQTRFEGDLAQTATSLRLETSKQVDRIGLLTDTLHTLEQTYFPAHATGFQSVLPQWLSYATMINKPITISQQGSLLSGVVKGLSGDGGLILQTNGTERTVFAGEVTVIGT